MCPNTELCSSNEALPWNSSVRRTHAQVQMQAFKCLQNIFGRAHVILDSLRLNTWNQILLLFFFPILLTTQTFCWVSEKQIAFVQALPAASQRGRVYPLWMLSWSRDALWCWGCAGGDMRQVGPFWLPRAHFWLLGWVLIQVAKNRDGILQKECRCWFHYPSTVAVLGSACQSIRRE